MQPNYPVSSRQRPLQKSMFLPQSQQYVNRNNPIEYQYQDIMKRSSINPDTNKFNSFPFNQPNIQPQTPVHQINPNLNPILNFSANTKYKEIQRTNQFEQVSQSPINSQLAIQQLQQKITQLSKLVESHDDILKKNNFSGMKDKSLVERQVQQIQYRLKQNTLPSMISRQTKEIYEHIFNSKLEIKTLRDEVNLINDKIKNQFLGLANNNQRSISTVNSVQKIDRSSESMSDLGENFLLLEKKILQIKKEMNNKNDELKNLILFEIQKSMIFMSAGESNGSIGSKSSSKMRSSIIQSTLHPIMMQYRESFWIKGQNHQNSTIGRTGISSPREKQNKQIVISSTNYFIDREGYLLDSQNRYIIDAKGHQIKLQQSHLALLKQHHVLS